MVTDVRAVLVETEPRRGLPVGTYFHGLRSEGL